MKKQFIVILLLFYLSPTFSFPQILFPKQDGFYRLTNHFIPEKWNIFNFNINPFSPVYSTEVLIPDTSYIKIEIVKNSNDSTKNNVVNSSLTNLSSKYLPAIYNLSWINTNDDNFLPVTDGIYSINFSAYKDSSLSKILYSHSISFPVMNGWTNVSSKINDNYIEYLPGYSVYKDMEIQFQKIDKEKEINWFLLGARIKNVSNQLSQEYILKMSFKFKLNEYGNAFTTLYSAVKNENKSIPYKIEKKIGFYKLEIIDITLRRGDFDYLIIHNLGSDLSIINLEELWKKLIN